MKSFALRLILLSTSLLLSASCYARQSNWHEPNWIFDFAYASGGDRLLSSDIYDDYGHSYDDIHAGSGYSISFGRELLFDRGMGLQLTGGYKADNIDNGYDSATFDRFTLDGLVWLDAEIFRFGIGATYELFPLLDMNDIGYGEERFQNALGGILQGDVWINNHMLVGLRYTGIEYVSEDDGHRHVNGDNMSVRLTFRF